MIARFLQVSFLSVLAGILLLLLFDIFISEPRRRAYEASPEGQRELALANAESERQSAFSTTELLVKLQLRDPDSAVFSGMRLVETDGKEVVCGLVNSRNGFGGMSGPTLFAHVRDDPITGTFILGAHANAVEKIGRYCGS